MSYTLRGTVKAIMDKQTFASGFEKREFVVTTDDRYPQDVNLACVKDNIAKLHGISVGDTVTVNFWLRGNEYQGRYFVNLQACDITVGAPSSGTQTDAPPAPPTDRAPVEDDGLPF